MTNDKIPLQADDGAELAKTQKVDQLASLDPARKSKPPDRPSIPVRKPLFRR